jgi:transcriptional regulator with XRE-family HTH domain
MKNSILNRCIEIAGNTNQLAKLSGVSQPALFKLATGKTKYMSVTTIKKLSKATGIPVADFLN